MSLVKHHVAVINADNDRLTAFSEMLGTDEYCVSTYQSPLDALKIITAESHPDIIITDLHHPDMNGWRLCALLKAQTLVQGRRIPVIGTTPVFRSPEFCSVAAGLGIDAVINPFCEATFLRKTVSNIIQNLDIAEKLNILAIDDDKNLLTFLERGFELSGIKITTTDNGKESIKLFSAIQPDITIIDHNLGDCKAMEILPTLMAARKKSDSIFIVIMGNSAPEIAMEYIQLGVDAHVQKPFTIPYLADVIYKARREHLLMRAVELLESNIKSVTETEKLLRDLYNNAPIGYHVIDTSGLITLMNSTELRWLGYSEEEIVGKKTIFDLETPASAIIGRKMFSEVLSSDKKVYGELEFVRHDGSVMPVLIHTMPIREKSGKVISCRTIVQDASERKKIESQLHYAQKMEAIRSLVEGIAHNFNNILTPILVNSSYLASEFPKKSEEHEISEDIVHAARRGANLVKQINRLINPSNELTESINLKKIISQTVNILQSTLDPSIRIKSAIHTAKVTIPGNIGEIEQALLNISLNARDAMPDGGQLLITLDENDFPGKPGKFLCISISDNGTGIPAEIQSRIFDPFFTTKGLANNAGLGLSAAYTSIKAHSGFIDVQSELGKGSTFRIFLPIQHKNRINALEEDDQASSSEVTSSLPENNVIGKTAATRKTILVIDDDVHLQKSISTVLKQAGYNVIYALDGKEGLKIITKALSGKSRKRTERTPRIDLVILDLVLPDQSGEEVLEDIRAVSTELPVLISTGCSTQKRLAKLLNMDVGTVVLKPFDKNLLLREVRRTLEQEA